MSGVAVDVTSRPVDDGAGYIAWCDDFPGLIGHGDDDDEAVEDLMFQIDARVLH